MEEFLLKKENDIVKGLKAEVKKDEQGNKKISVKFDVENKLGYDGCGTHTHQ